MQKCKFIFSLLFILFLQLNTNAQYYAAKEYSKETSAYFAKEFLFREVFDVTTDVTIFEVVPLAAANSGELTTLFYKTKDGKKEGLVLGFWGDKVNKYGVYYKGYEFKNYNKEYATNLLFSIKTIVEDLKNDWQTENTNLHFKLDDIDFLVTKSNDSFHLRLFWGNFDATWEQTAFERSLRRFMKNSN